jgi:hypothetical protein
VMEDPPGMPGQRLLPLAPLASRLLLASIHPRHEIHKDCWIPAKDGIERARLAMLLQEAKEHELVTRHPVQLGVFCCEVVE